MWRLLSFRLFSMVRPLQTADASGRRTYKIAGIFKEDDLQGIRRFQGYAETLFEVGLQVDDRHIWWFHSNHEMWIQNKCKRLIFWYDKKIPDYFSVAGAP